MSMSLTRAVAEPIVNLDASGAATIEGRVPEAAVHTAISHMFRLNVPASSGLFSAFTWSDLNTEGHVDASAGDTYITAQKLDQATFAAALAQVINDAVGGKLTGNATVATTHDVSGNPLGEAYAGVYALDSGASRTVRYELKSEIRYEMEQLLNSNNVAEYLEGDSLGSFQFAVDASGAAAEMATQMDVSGVLENFILQFPNRPSVVGLSGESYTGLPVIPGDELSFVFTSTPEVTITELPEEGAANVNGAPNPGSEPALGMAGLNISTSTRKIAFVVRVTA
jgi:hypothetical protein